MKERGRGEMDQGMAATVDCNAGTAHGTWSKSKARKACYCYQLDELKSLS